MANPSSVFRSTPRSIKLEKERGNKVNRRENHHARAGEHLVELTALADDRHAVPQFHAVQQVPLFLFELGQSLFGLQVDTAIDQAGLDLRVPDQKHQHQQRQQSPAVGTGVLGALEYAARCYQHLDHVAQAEWSGFPITILRISHDADDHCPFSP